MRNILKTAARTASSRSRRSVRGVAAVVASFALAASLGSYPVDAQETTPSETETATTEAESAVETISESTVRWERSGDVERVIVDDPDGESWGYGWKASDEDIFAIKREGEGDIEDIIKVTIDGREIDPQYYGFVNGPDADYLAFDIDALYMIPPAMVDFEVRTTGKSKYSVAESDEVPLARELSASGFGQAADARATVNPEGVGMVRAASQPNSKEQLALNGLSYSLISGASGGKPSKIHLETKVGGTLEKRNFYLTELVVKYNKSTSTALEGPVTVRKNGDPACTIQQTDIKPVSTRTGSAISINLTSCRIAVWKGSGDNIQIDLYGPGSDPRNVAYAVELYGAYDPNTTSPEPPTPDTPARPDRVWTSDVEKGTLEMRATQKKGQTSKVTLTRTFNEASVISGPFFARVDNQNGYDLGTEVIMPQVQVIGSDGKVLYKTSGDAKYGSDIAPFDSVNYPTNGWGGLYIKGPDSLSVPAGSKVVVTMGFRPEPDHSPTVEEDVLSPTGPGELDLTFGARPGGATGGDSESSAPVEIQSCKATESRRSARTLTDNEKSDGTTVFVAHSPNATGIGSRTTTRLSRQLQGDENFSTLSESRWVYNALSYNRADNWIYAVSQRNDDPNNAAACPPGHLLQINPETGEVHNIGRIRRSIDLLNILPSPFAKNDSVNDLDYLNTGWIGYNDGERLYVANSSTSGSRAVYEVALPEVGKRNPQSSFFDNLLNVASVYAEDHALLFDPNQLDPSKDQYAQYGWGLVSPAGVKKLGYPDGTLLMERYNISTNRVDRFVIDNPQTVGGKQVPTGKIWGKAWTYGNGNLGFGTGGQSYSNQSIQIKVDDPFSGSPKFTIVSVVENAPVSFNTDGTSNVPMPVPPVDLAVKKVALNAGNDAENGNALANLKKLNRKDSGRTRYWAVVVSNLSDSSSSGFTVTDQIPSSYDQNTIRGYSELSGQWDKFNVTQNYPVPGSASVEFNSGRLVGKSQRTFYFSADLKAGEECEVNTVTIRGNEVEKDPSNNEGSDSCLENGVKVRLAKVDVDDIDDVPNSDAFLPNAEFRIDRLDRTGSVQLIRDADGFLALPVDLTPVDGSEGGLAPGEYQIVEAKSPSGYSLLTAPIKFRVNAADSDERLTFDNANSVGYVRVVSELSADNDLVIAVGDVRQGSLPATGGAGLQLPILFGGALIVAGALMGRRKVAA